MKKKAKTKPEVKKESLEVRVEMPRDVSKMRAEAKSIKKKMDEKRAMLMKAANRK